MSQDNIENCSLAITTKLTDDLFRLLQVREKNESMAKDWLLYLKTTKKFSKLTPGEVYLSFKMAMARELLDSKNEEINMLPELSINTTSKILSSYIDWKIKNNEYQLAKTKIKNLAENVEPTEDEKKKIKDDFLVMLFNEIKENKFSHSAWCLYKDLEIAGKINITDEGKIKLYQAELKKYIPIQKAEYRKKEALIANNLIADFQKSIDDGKKFAYVQNRCKAIVVCNYLKNLKTFEEFLKALDNGVD